MSIKVKHVVADTGAFIKNAQFREIAENVYTVPEVIAESIDRNTRRRINLLPISINFKEPSSEALHIVSTFAKKTGDYPALSAVDLKILSLTYDLEKQYKGTEHLRKEPPTKPQYSLGCKPEVPETNVSKQYSEGEALPTSLINEKEAESDDEEEEEVDDDGWITPSNISDIKRSMGVVTAPQEDIVVGCLTTDFAMQNVLIQMGLHVLSLEGMLIKKAKSFVLRCFGCLKITKDTSKVFCPHCGNRTLKRLSTTIEEDGTVKYWLAKNYTIRTKGMKYSLPKPQGGKHAVNPILFADQPMPDQRPSKKSLQKIDVLSEDIIADVSPFVINDVTSRAAQLGITGRQWMKRNDAHRGFKRRGK